MVWGRGPDRAGTLRHTRQGLNSTSSSAHDSEVITDSQVHCHRFFSPCHPHPPTLFPWQPQHHLLSRSMKRGSHRHTWHLASVSVDRHTHTHLPSTHLDRHMHGHRIINTGTHSTQSSILRGQTGRITHIPTSGFRPPAADTTPYPPEPCW